MTLQHRRGAWLVALVALAAAAALSFRSARDYIASEAAVHRVLALRQTIADTLSLLKDAETSQRGFLLTADPNFLEQHARAAREIPEQLAALHALTAQDRAQAQSVSQIGNLAADRLALLDLTIQLSQSGKREEALAIVREGRGTRWMNALRIETAQMLEREARALEANERAVHERLRSATFSLVSCLALAVLSAFGGLMTARRDIASAQRRAAEIQASELALRALADHASDMVRILGRDGRAHYVSPSCEALLGYSVHEMLAFEPGALLHPDESARFLKACEDVHDAGDTSPVVLHRIRTRAGVFRWFETKLQIASGQLEPGRLHVTSHDVTERKHAEDALRTQTAWLRSVLANIGDGVVVLDADKRFVVINPIAREYFYQHEGEIAMADWSKNNRAYLPDGETFFPPERGPLTRALRGEACDRVELMIYDREGRARSFEVSARPLFERDRTAGCVAIFHDISAQRQAAKELHESEQRFRVLSEASFEGVAITQTGIVIDVNPHFASSLGKEPAELVGKVGLDLFAAEDREHVNEASAESDDVFEARMLRSDGTRFPVEVRGRKANFRGETVRIMIIRDITEKRAHEAELKRQAELLRALSLHDDLTGLYNRRGFVEHAVKQLIVASRRSSCACLFFVDLNAMKAINDELGHEAGDRALVATGSALARVFREADVVARLGGDEFAILAGECSAKDIEPIRARLRAAVDDYNAGSGEPFTLSMSVGAAVFDPATPIDLETLMANADADMYTQKAARSEQAPRNRPRSGPLAMGS